MTKSKKKCRLIFIVFGALLFVLMFSTGCGGAENTPEPDVQSPVIQADVQSDSPADYPEDVDTSASTPDAEPEYEPWLGIKLLDIKFLGEFESIHDPEFLFGDTGIAYANDVKPDSRFVIFHYEFYTMAPKDGPWLVTLGRSVHLWRGDEDTPTEEQHMEWRSIVADSRMMGSTFDEEGFHFRGIQTASLAYSPGEYHDQFFVSVVSNSIPIEEINIRFSETYTVSEIGISFNAMDIQ